VTASAVIGAVLLMLVAPAVPGIATKTKSWLTGRRGAPVTQLYWDLVRLLGKGAVYSSTTTWVFRVAPVAGIAAPLLALGLLPLDGGAALFSFSGDFVGFAALLALGRFAFVLAALDTGSSFEGMGASRDAAFASLVEPALFINFLVLVMATGQLTLAGALGGAQPLSWSTTAPALAMATVSLFFVMLAEASRLPVDDPATHLELTMIHEVAALDYSGPDLALVQYGAALRMTLMAALPAMVLVSRASRSPAMSLALLGGGIVGMAIVVGVVESAMARLRLSRVPQFLVAASVLASLGAILQLLT
jgi:formate hydrogenlyase subunit 4